MLVCVATLLGYAGKWMWALDLLSAFRMHYLAILFGALVAVLGTRRFRWAALYGLGCLLNLVAVMPYYWPVKPTGNEKAETLRIVSLNVNTENDRYDLVEGFLRDRHPDFVLLMEIDVAWVRALEGLKGDYPYQLVEPRGDNFGIALLSRHPFLKGEVAFVGESGVPSVIAYSSVNGHAVTLVGTHPLPPLHADTARLRNEQLAAIASRLRGETGPTLLVGDLNMTPWSSAFDELAKSTGLRDSSLGRGVHPTWPAMRIWLGIPIDFCLVSKGVEIRDANVGSAVGSDHLPLVVDFRL
ncbi:MAG: endonuclease/exonuclease/phosphatase family protein [Fimbriimonadaceae bacterium]|nr:endonuclease/exonuclease/phosphatase family protein [Chthonomonadaceae bacterium]MCO5296586.1 endonuclease/exonuclease/phosphatase family protein [Fimbriimonadaceae bacterium]